MPNERKTERTPPRPQGLPADSLLGAGGTSLPSKDLQSFANPAPDRDYEIVFDCPEFTCLCPVTGQPDFARFEIRYVPDRLCVELKSLKLYLWSFRNEGAFHEAVTNRICDDLYRLMKPRSITVVGTFNVRGGIGTSVSVTRGRQAGPRSRSR